MMLRPASPRVYSTFRRLNRLPSVIRFTSVSSLSSSEVSLPYRISMISCAYSAKLSSKPAFELPNAPSVTYAAVTHPIPGPALSSRTRETIALASEYLLPVYVRPPFVLERGKGCWVWDCEGRKYLDFTAGIAVNALGHADEGVSEVSYRLFSRHAAPRPCSGMHVSDRWI
jgi:acetylornithine aminotransferase